MAKQAVIEIQCDRCQRKEYLTPVKEGGSDGPILKLEFDSTAIVFQDLCSSCKKSVTNLVANIRKEIKGRSPNRKSKTKKSPTDGGSSTDSAG